ncbi:MAG TPA: hypothetical protein VGC88_12875 [Terriglobales bacterium]|jgi:hypothetical protein
MNLDDFFRTSPDYDAINLRHERRFKIVLPVCLRYIADEAKTEMRCTYDVSYTGLRLGSVSGIEVNDVVQVEYKMRPARFKVVWKGDEDGTHLMGLEAIEAHKVLWDEQIREELRRRELGEALN